MEYVLDDNFIASKRKEVSKKFKVKDTGITFTTESEKDSYEDSYSTNLVAAFHRERTKQEIERKIEDVYYEERKNEKQERETYEILKKKFEGEI